MSREYFTRRPMRQDGYPYYEADSKEFLARTVYETEELIDTGILDEAGNKVLAREKKNPIGFVWPKR